MPSLLSSVRGLSVVRGFAFHDYRDQYWDLDTDEEALYILSPVPRRPKFLSRLFFAVATILIVTCFLMIMVLVLARDYKYDNSEIQFS